MRYLQLSIALLCLSVSITAKAQIITTSAGTGIYDYTGDGGPATAATLNDVFGLAIDFSGNIYVADLGNNVIRRITPSGIISTVAGNGYLAGAGWGVGGYAGDGGPATDAELASPCDIAISPSGYMYICDLTNNVVRVVDPSGIISNFAGVHLLGGMLGDGGPATAANLLPLAVTCRGSDVYIIDGGERIRKVDYTGIIQTVAGTGIPGYSGDGGPATAAEIHALNGHMTFDAAGNLYFADYANNVIRKVTTAGIISTIAGNGTPGYSGDGGPATAAQLFAPKGIALDPAGNLFIADFGNRMVRKVNTAGIITMIAGSGTTGYTGDGGPSNDATFNGPNGLVVDFVGRLWIADQLNSVVRRIDTTSDHYPVFAELPDLTLCGDSAVIDIDTLLKITDADAGQTETWTVVLAPLHGSLGGFSAMATSTGSSLIPSGLTYTPAAGYIGTDFFTIRISDSIAVAFTKILVTITPCGTLITKIPDDHSDELKTYPNPSNGSFTLEIPETKNAAIITIADILGRITETRNTTEHKVSFDLSDVPSGNYFVR